MSGSKITVSLWVVCSNTHIRVTISNDLDLVALSGQYRELFIFAGRALWFVEASEGLASIRDPPRLRALYVLRGSH